MLQVISALKNYQGIMLINDDNNVLYFHNCERKIFGTEHAATFSSAPLTHTEDTYYSSRAILTIFKIFQHFDKVSVKLSLLSLKLSSIVHTDFMSPDTPMLLLCPTQSRKCFWQVRKTSLQLVAKSDLQQRNEGLNSFLLSPTLQQLLCVKTTSAWQWGWALYSVAATSLHYFDSQAEGCPCVYLI